MGNRSLLIFIFVLLLGQSHGLAQSLVSSGDNALNDDDLNIGSDIFSDFNEDLEATRVLEDERFFRYGRFFSYQLGFGMTTFDGNRGQAYDNDHPSFGMGLNYFLDFRTSMGLGFEYSKHFIFIDEPLEDFNNNKLGLVEVNMLRVYFSYRYYIETYNLGTAITYSNPYFSTRLEYWYVTNKFEDQNALPDDSGGGLGVGLGGGFEFPIKLKESYIGVEFLWHSVNFHDKFTQSFRPVFQDLNGNGYTVMVSYVINW
jgi:hypothetical protein